MVSPFLGPLAAPSPSPRAREVRRAPVWFRVSLARSDFYEFHHLKNFSLLDELPQQVVGAGNLLRLPRPRVERGDVRLDLPVDAVGEVREVGHHRRAVGLAELREPRLEHL